MNKKNLPPIKQIIIRLFAYYFLFILAFLTLGLFDNKIILIIYFCIDVILIVLSLHLNCVLFRKEYKLHFLGKIVLLFITLCLMAFVIFAFLFPENGLPPVLFS